MKKPHADLPKIPCWRYRKHLQPILLAVLLLLSPILTYGQVSTLTGTITDEIGETLPGVNIVLKGTSSGTLTDINGNYSLDVEQGSELVFTFIGFQTQEITLGGQSVLDVQLVVSIATLDELVVTGYGTQRKGELTGAISVINTEDIVDIVTQSPLQSLQGRVPGMFITKDGTPGGGTRGVLVRGMNTLGNNDPLYIIDGHPVPRDRVDRLDPRVIKSMQVLKDAASASIYGSRASNGVIIITTKQAESGKLQLDFNTSVVVENYTTQLNMLTADERGEVLWRGSINDGSDPNLDHPHYTYGWNGDYNNPVLNSMQTIEFLDPTFSGGIRAADTDWFKEVTQTGFTVRNNLTLSSGTDTHSLLVNIGHHKQEGVVKGTDYERFTARVNSSVKLFNKKVTIGQNLQITSSSQTPMGYGQGGTAVNLARIVLPLIPVYAENGLWAGPIGAGFSNRINPLQVPTLTKDWTNDVASLYGNIYLEYKIFDNLTFKSSYGADNTSLESVRINPRYVSGFLNLNINDYQQTLTRDNNYQWFNTLNYSLGKAKHRVNILAGTEANSSESSLLGGYKQDFLLEDIEYFFFDAGTGSAILNGSGTGFRLASYFTKVNYSFDQKYLATATLRYDGSSRFGRDEKFGFFPAFSVGWKLSAENFMQDQGFISHLLLRVGAGTTGNQLIDDYASVGTFVPAYGRMNSSGRTTHIAGQGRRASGTAYDIHGINTGNLPSGVVALQTANPKLKWESTDEVNVGVDFGLLQQRLTGSLDYFNRTTKDILIRPPVLGVVGEGGQKWENGATMENKGWELVLAYGDEVGDFGYQFAGQISHFKDKVTFLPEQVVRAYPGNVEKTIIGHSISSMFGYVSDGLFQNQGEVDSAPVGNYNGIGRVRYVDLNGDGVIDPKDQDWLGTTIPNLMIGLNTILTYKDFRLTFFLDAAQGIERRNSFKNQNTLLGAFSGQNGSKLLLDAWTPQNPNSDVPAVSLSDRNNETRLSDRQIENSSYLKLRFLQLNYNLPDKIIGSWASSVGVFVAGTELFIIKSKEYTNPDPESPSSFYPITRSVQLGLNVSF